jgi:hypothetical protein
MIDAMIRLDAAFRPFITTEGGAQRVVPTAPMVERVQSPLVTTALAHDRAGAAPRAGLNGTMDLPEKLRLWREQLLRKDPDSQQKMPYPVSTWSAQIGRDRDFQDVVRAYPKCLGRKDVAQQAAEARQEGTVASLRRLFIATMLWGYGEVGYGPWRTREMLEDRRLPRTLQATFALLGEGRLLEAYRQFDVTRCGPAFFSKFFYFVGLGRRLDPCPLILDSRVAQSLGLLLGDGLRTFASVTRGEDGSVAYVDRFAEGYERYVRTMNDWARQLGCRPDSIELLLFDPPTWFAE